MVKVHLLCLLVVGYGSSDSHRGVGSSEFIPHLSTEHYTIGKRLIINVGSIYQKDAEQRPLDANMEKSERFDRLFQCLTKRYSLIRGGAGGAEYIRAKNEIELHLILFYSLYYVE